MRTFLFTILFFSSAFSLFSQSVTNEPEKLKLKRGIYFTFKEINAGSAARSDSFIIKERKNGNLALTGGGKFTFKLASDDKAELREIRKQFVGISDGVNFYVSDRFTVGGWQGMTLCILSGPYLIALIEGSAGQYTGGGIVGSMIKVGNAYLIDLKNRTSTKLTKKVLKEMLSRYSDISKEFENKMDLMDHSVEIIDKINRVEHRHN